MSFAMTEDGIRLYYEETGSGTPLIFVHEFAGDHRSWERQMRHFGRRYRTIAFNARGYPPSDVPASQVSYSQGRACDDIRSLLDHLSVERAHIVGLSMGGFATLHFGFRHAPRALSLCVAGCGYGAEPHERERFRREARAIADLILSAGMPAFAEKYAYGPTRVQFENKDPRGFAEFARHVRGKGMRLGLWIEPRAAVSSEMYRAHPELFLRPPEQAFDPSEVVRSYAKRGQTATAQQIETARTDG